VSGLTSKIKSYQKIFWRKYVFKCMTSNISRTSK